MQTRIEVIKEREAELTRLATQLSVPTNENILSALGHPGYGEEFAEATLRIWSTNAEINLHEAVYRNDGSGRRLDILGPELDEALTRWQEV